MCFRRSLSAGQTKSIKRADICTEEFSGYEASNPPDGVSAKYGQGGPALEK